MTKAGTHIVCKQETNIALLQKDVSYMKDKLDTVHEKIVGNGKPGIVDELKDLKTMKDDYKSTKIKVDDMERKMWYFAGAVAVITLLITFIAPKIVTAWLG